MLLKLAIFVVGCFLFARFPEAKFSRFSAKISTAESTLTISILGAGLIIAAIADQLGFSLAIGALVVMYECRALNEALVAPDTFAAMVIVSLATCIIAPVVLRRRLADTQ